VAGEPRRWRWKRRDTRDIDADPARIEADRAGRVYRVSHVVDGEFVELLRQNHINHYHFAIGRPTLRDFTGKKMIGAFSSAK
jgi:hypothetical protein